VVGAGETSATDSNASPRRSTRLLALGNEITDVQPLDIVVGSCGARPVSCFGNWGALNV
jgi:hypothetical protein